MEENYDLGKVIRIEEVSGGYCNNSYAVWMGVGDHGRPYFLRMYNPGTTRNEIRFENALLNHLQSSGFTLAAAMVEGVNGETLAKTPPPENHRGTEAFWALFEYLDGEDKYTWTQTDLTDKELMSAAEILARLHHCGHGFKKPPGADHSQPRIMDCIPTFKRTFSEFLEKADDRQCDRLFKSNFNLIYEILESAESLGVSFQGMPELPIHCDYHPGNLKFAGQQVVGLFDFDWSKVDYRLFDVALALVYFASCWEDHQPGLRSDTYTLFLGAYNRACRHLVHITPMTDQEKRYLVPMLSIANLFVLNWTLVDFYDTPEPHDEAHPEFINHSIGLLKWIESNGDKLELWTENSFSRESPQ
jgi:homoserine kinase type II